MSPYGTYNMAGNVKEWCWNETTNGKRYILGGSYLEPGYMFREPDKQDPFERKKTYGLRCVKYRSKDIYQTASFDRQDQVQRDYRKESPVGDDVFAVLKSFYDYEKKPLNSTVELVQDEGYLRIERVTFDAAYGQERMAAYVFLPMKVAPPYRAIIYFPGSGAQYFESSDRIEEIVYGRYLDSWFAADALSFIRSTRGPTSGKEALTLICEFIPRTSSENGESNT